MPSFLVFTGTDAIWRQKGKTALKKYIHSDLKNFLPE
jgi:hypothetical protein